MRTYGVYVLKRFAQFILVAFIGVFVSLTLYLFPRRDIAAPT